MCAVGEESSSPQTDVVRVVAVVAPIDSEDSCVVAAVEVAHSGSTLNVLSCVDRTDTVVALLLSSVSTSLPVVAATVFTSLDSAVALESSECCCGAGIKSDEILGAVARPASTATSNPLPRCC